MNTHNKESVQQRLQMSYGHTEPYIVSHRRNSSFAARNCTVLDLVDNFACYT